MIPPLAILAIGVAIVLTAILWLRLNAFLGLIAAALAVSLLAPGAANERVTRVAAAFGDTTAGVGLAIVFASVIGACLVECGAADRIVQACLAVFGRRNAAGALAASGFVLAVPVFFDTVFYLLVPLARSTYRLTGKHYLRYLLAIGAGGAVTHTMVPPTPGPLLMADQLHVNVGLLALVGAAVAVPMTLSGLAFAAWSDRTLTLSQPPVLETSPDELAAAQSMPPLAAAVIPILMPLALITMGPLLAAGNDATFAAAPWLILLTDKNLALFLAAIASLVLCRAYRRPGGRSISQQVEEAVLSAGGIVLITAAGGAFGAMLREAGVGQAVSDLFAVESRGAGFTMLWIAFAIAALIKTSQGSTTVALVTASAMLRSMQGQTELGLHPVYLCTAMGSGAMITSWMNDSGFWIFCRMGGLTDREGLKTWTPIMIVMGAAGMATTLALAALFPGV